MLKLNRDSVLKSFMEKVKEAKRLNMKDVKLTLKEIDDLAQVIYELMSEKVSELLEKVYETKEEIKKEEIKTEKKRRVIETIAKEQSTIAEESEENDNDNVLFGGTW